MKPNASPQRGWHNRGYLPHCDFPGLIQSVSIRLFDSVPTDVIERWVSELNTARDEKLKEKLLARIERYADMGYGSCFLADSHVAKLVENAVLHFDDDWYDVLAWCIMPNHLHTLFVPRVRHSMSEILQNWKSFTSLRANGLLSRRGEFT